MSIIRKLRKGASRLKREFVRLNAVSIVNLFYGDIWKLREKCLLPGGGEI